MFNLFNALLSVNESKWIPDQIKCPFVNDVPFMVRPNLIDMNSVNLKHYPFMISLNKCTVICNVL